MKHAIAALSTILLLMIISCSDILGDPVRLVFEVEYLGDWSGFIVAADYYGDDYNLTKPKDGTEGIAISGTGHDEYSYVIDNNWYYIFVGKDDLELDGNGEPIPNTNTLTVRIIKYNPSQDSRIILIEESTTNKQNEISAHVAVEE